MSNFENYEGTALDTSIMEEVQPGDGAETQTENTADETVATEGNSPVSDAAIETKTTEPTPEKYNIEGVGEFTADEIREMRNSGLRQSDYTRKTQEIAKQREELKDAQELYDYLRANPHLVQAMKAAEANPNGFASMHAPTAESQMLRDLAYNQKALETDLKVSALKQKYGDIDEVALYEKAAELRTDDLEFVYKALSYDKGQFDERSAIEKAKAELRAELENNKTIVSTTVSSQQSAAPVQEKVQLTEQEKRIAAAMGLSESEYAKWK